METDAQGDAGPVSRITGQDAKATEHMAMDVLRLGGIFRRFFTPGMRRPSFGCLTPSPTMTWKGPSL